MLWKTTKAYEDKEKKEEWSTASQLAGRGQNEKQSGERTEGVKPVKSVDVSPSVYVKIRGVWIAARGMCSLSQVSPGAEADRSTSLPREGVDWAASSVFTSATLHPRGKKSGIWQVLWDYERNFTLFDPFKHFKLSSIQCSFKLGIKWMLFFNAAWRVTRRLSSCKTAWTANWTVCFVNWVFWALIWKLTQVSCSCNSRKEFIHMLLML